MEKLNENKTKEVVEQYGPVTDREVATELDARLVEAKNSLRRLRLDGEIEIVDPTAVTGPESNPRWRVVE